MRGMTDVDQIFFRARRTFTIAVAGIALAIAAITVDTLVIQRHSRTLRVGFNEFSPYISVTGDGKPAGLAVDVLKEAARRGGQNLSWRQVEDGESALRDGRIDFYPLLTVTPNRIGKFHFSDYWWQNRLDLVSSQRRPVSSGADTSGRKIGVSRRGLILDTAKTLLPRARLVLKPDVESLVDALCSGEIDALFADTRSVQLHMIDRPLPCPGLKLKMVPVAGATLPLGTAARRPVSNRADLLYTHINELVADGTLANLAATYMMVSPGGNQQLAQLIQSRRHSFLLGLACLGLCLLTILFVFIGVRMRAARHAIEEAHGRLEESEQRFHAFMDHLSANAFMKDSNGRLVYVNRADARMLESRAEECLGKTNFELMPRPVAEQLCANDRLVLESNCARQFTESVPDREGDIHHWLSFKFPFRSRSGEIFLGGVSIEITEMIQAQKALRESESRYRQIVEFAGDIIVRCDARGRVSYINDMGARVLKLPADQLRGRKALSFVRREDRRRLIDRLRLELAAGASDLYLEVPVVTGDGSVLWLGQTIRILRHGGLFSGLQAISRDITERRRIEAELRASEERFRVLYENGPVAYHEIDRQGVIRCVNRAECDLLGIPAAELIGRRVQDLLIPEEREASYVAVTAKVSESLPLLPFTRTFLRPDGRRVRVEIHENLLRDEHGKVIGIHSVLLDMTQRHLVETQDHDRAKLSEMIAQQQPLDQILHGISLMIRHQNESLCCVPLRLVNEDELPRLEPFCTCERVERISQTIRDLGSEASSLWPSREFRVRHLTLSELGGSPRATHFAAAAMQTGFQSCWSIPIVSSSFNPLGTLLVFSPHAAEATTQERQLLESASQVASVAIENRHMNDLLAFQASHDCLTRLPNRSSFEQRLEEAISQTSAKLEELAVLFVDLDRFKEVNDTFGHSGGDELLRQVTVRLRRCMGRGDMLARIGGDEFSLLLPGLHDAAEANRVAADILRAFHSPFDIGGREVCITASIGISFYPQDGLDASTLQRNSDTAMYRAKNTGKNNFRCYAGDNRAREDGVATVPLV
jgi:diguanylate cyclase (GGDEF)-like protein/PAS domain S-box-containing protein